VVFATHRDLEQLVAAGKFGHDLYYRVNVMTITSPPLPEHTEVVPLLVHHFLQHYAKLNRKQVESIEPEALALLQQYAWPGNVRELENIVQRCIIMSEGDSIETDDLPENIREQQLPDFVGDLPAGSFERQLRDFKRKLVYDAVQQCNGNKTLAAQRLSISRAYLHRLLRQVPGSAECTNLSNELGPTPLTMAAGQ
jgi:DNA-binding NtrC family response regulator